MKGDLWLHQATALGYGLDLPAYGLFMGVGTGKTRVALHLIEAKSPGYTLVVCPKSVMDTWQEQAAQYLPHVPVTLITGSTSQRRKLLDGAPVGIVVMNYEYVWRAPGVRRMRWTGVVLDESHRIKAAGSKVSKFMALLGKQVPWRLCLSATPMHNSPLDVYGQYRFLDPSVFGTRWDVFRYRYALWGGFENRQVLRYQNLDEMRERMRPLSFIVESDDVLDLPPATTVRRVGELEPAAAKVYKQLRKEFVAEVGNSQVVVGNALTLLLRLQEITSGYVDSQPISSAKYSLLCDTLRDIPPDKPVVVFCRFTHDLYMVHQAAASLGRLSFELSGAGNELADWKARGGILAVQVQAGSVGVDFTAADIAIYYSLGYSLGEYTQSRGRLRRPGQTRPVLYIHLVLRGTVDEHLLRAFDTKSSPIDQVVAALKQEENHVRP